MLVEVVCFSICWGYNDKSKLNSNYGSSQMKQTSNKLSALEVKNAKPGEKPFKLSDGGGMYLLINPNGSKYWRLKYRHSGKEKSMALGVYPDVGLSGARAARDEARALIAHGADPMQLRREQKRRRREEASNTFKAAAMEWYNSQKAGWSDRYGRQALTSLEKYIFPKIGGRPINNIAVVEVLAVIRRTQKQDAQKAAGLLQLINQIFLYACDR